MNSEFERGIFEEDTLLDPGSGVGVGGDSVELLEYSELCGSKRLKKKLDALRSLL